MRGGLATFFAVLLVCPSAFADAAAAVFGSAPAVDHVRVSPDGARVLAIASGAGRRGLAVIDLAAGTNTVALQVKERKRHLDFCEWVSNRRIVCAMFVFPDARGGLPYPHRHLVRLVAVDHDGGRPLALLDRPPAETARFGGRLAVPYSPYNDKEHALLHPLPDDPEHVLIAAPREAVPYRSVYRVHVDSGAAARIVGWQAGIVLWHADQRGRVRVGTGHYEFGPIEQIREPRLGPTAVAADAAGRFQRVDVADLAASIGEREQAGPHILGFSANGERVYYEARIEGADRSAVWAADPTTLKPLRRIVSHPQRDVRAEAIGGRDCGVVGFMHPLPGRPFTWLDADFGGTVGAARGGVEHGDIVAVTSMSSDCRRAVLLATDGRVRQGFYLLDRETGALRLLGEQFPTTAENRSSRRRVLSYRTRDGLELPMAVTTPAAGRSPPIVVLLDGTPGPRSAAALDPWPHYFASRGYAVAQPTFRGARGYGTAFHVAGLHQRGAKLQEDVADAVAWLGEAGLGDPGRLCFVGRGRGGHFALAAAFAEAGMAGRCAAAYAATDVVLTKRAEHNPFDLRICSHYPCGDWMRWADPATMRRISNKAASWASPEVRRNLHTPKSSLLRSPLVEAEHPGFPVLVHSDGRSVVHENGSRRFSADLKKFGVFEELAPVGSDDEVEFLAAAEALFSEVLHGSETKR